MGIRFDSLQFKSNAQYGVNGPIVAEVGVIVDNLPSDAPDSMGVDLPVHVDEGYYYVSMVCRQDPGKSCFDLDRDKRYVVSKVSIIEYIFGFASDDEMPDFYEDYRSIGDAADSDFLDFFLFENRLVHESNMDRAWINTRRHEKEKDYGEGKTTIRIESLDNIEIRTRLAIGNNKEIEHEIVLTETSPGFIGEGVQFGGGKKRTLIIPWQNFILYENGEVKTTVPILEDLYDSDYEYFSAFAKAEKTTKQNVLQYFKDNTAELESRFTKDEIEDLKAGILGNGLGIKEYRV